MPNQTEIECYFKSSELAALCKKGKDIIINFKATYPPGKSPKFEISASAYKGSEKSSVKGSLLGGGDDSGSGGTTGCPQPCH
ncbi:MAG TPA: hypothetical protein VG847_07180 [Chitinophagaceae bacterium]|nr:hypothetical protein [Chitinophagaceae bacterium]